MVFTVDDFQSAFRTMAAFSKSTGSRMPLLTGAGIIVASISLMGYMRWRKKRTGLRSAPEESSLHAVPLSRAFSSSSADGSHLGVKVDRPGSDSVTVSVPATSANLGSGYDCVGLAIDLWNELTVSRAEKFSMTAEGYGADELPLDETNLVVQGLQLAFKAANKPLPPLKYHLKQRIPHARGLGSSSAAIVGGLVAGLVLSGHELEVTGKEELLQLACDIEGHPDNVAPCIWGGYNLAFMITARIDGLRSASSCTTDLCLSCSCPISQASQKSGVSSRSKFL